MTKSLALTFVAVVSCLSFFGQGDTNFDCQADSTCDHVVDFAFTLDANQEDALTFSFTGTLVGGGVVLQWPGGGTSYPSDLSLSLCSPDGDCVAIEGYSGILPGTSLGGWPTNWNNAVAGDNVACFSFGDLTLSGSGNWTLTGLNTYSSSAAGILFEGSVTLFTDCTPQPEPCTDETACNFGALEDCTYPGCLKAHACNYNPDAGCLDDESCVYDYCGDCANGPCEWEQPFAFSLGPNEIGSQDIAFDGELVGVRVSLDWPGVGTSYPDDLSLSFCTGGACVAIEGYSGALTGELIGDWPSIWQNALDGTNEACFSFLDESLFGDGTLTLTALNTYSASEPDVVFEGVVTLMYACNSVTLCEDEAACNFGALTDCVFPGCTDVSACNFDEAAGCDDGGCDYACLGCMDVAACNYNPEATQSDGSCTYPGCNDPEACNYDETAGCDDGTCEYEQHIFVPNTDGTYGSPVFEWCGPLPDCSNPIIGCPIPSGYIEVDHPCVELILENLATCGASWTPTCALELLLCTQYDLGCTNEAACNFDPDAGYDDNSCIFPGTPCDDGIDCTTDDILNLQCECEGQTGDADGDGLCVEDDCDDSNPGLPDALGRCDLPVAGCSNGEALNYSSETGEETACILAGDCGEPLIAPDWAHGFTGWMAPEHWAFSHPDLTALDDRALVLHSPTNGDTDTAKASITAPANLIIQFTFSYHSADAGPMFDPPMVLVNGEVKQVMDYIVDTPPPGQAMDETAFWFHNQPIMPSPDVAPDPTLLPPDHLLPMGLLIDGADTWDYPYQMPVALEVDSGDVMTLAVATTDGQANGAAMAVTAITRERYCPGCTDSGACNFDPLATHIDGSCDYSCIGCMEEEACDFDPEATLPADACDYSCYGCMDEAAYNHDPEATIEDGSCDFCSQGIPPSIVAAGTVPTGSAEDRDIGYTLLANDGDMIESRLQEAGFFMVDETTDFRSMAGAADHIIGLTVDSALKGFGVNLDGVLDIPMGLPPIARIETGTRHAMALGADGLLYSWGSNAFGQLDFQIEGGLAGIAAGNRHSLAWDSTGTIVISAGSNTRGQLDVPEGIQVLDVAGSNHNVALLLDSTVVCWGHNEFGQCDVPEGMGKAVAVAASRHSSMALMEDSTLVVWGRLELLQDIGKAQAIHGNPSRDGLAAVDADGYPHILVNLGVVQVQMRNRVMHAQGEGKCLDWCVDRDGDGLCDVEDECIGYDEECECICLNDENGDGICDELQGRGCMELGADNYSRWASIPGPCIYAGSGCASPIACNYDPNASDLFQGMVMCEFESCGGCTDAFGCNYDPDAKWDDGSCDYTTCTGCDDVNACNFNPKVLPADSCDYCSCHVVEPSIHIDSEYFIYINSKGEARMGGSIGLPFTIYQTQIQSTRIDGRVIPGVRAGEIWGPSAILLGIDSSIMVINENADVFVREEAIAVEAQLEELHLQDVRVSLLEADYNPPTGHDFVAVETHMGTYAAVRADGTMKVWGSMVSRFDSGIEFGEGDILGGEELTVSEWAEGLSNVVDVAMGGFWDIIALHGDGSLSCYGITNLIPDGLDDVISLEGDLNTTMLQRSDGSHHMLLTSVFTGAYDPNYVAELIPLPDVYTNEGQVAAFDNTIIVRSAALLEDGRVIFGSVNPLSLDEVDNLEDPFLTNQAVVIPAGTFGYVVDVEASLMGLTMLNEEGILTYKTTFELAYEFGTEEQIQETDSLLALPQSDSLLLVYGNSLPNRALLGPPTDCYGCADSDGDGICDLVDLCDGVVDALGECGGDCLLDEDGDGVCDLLDRPGCTYEEASNFDEVAMYDDGSCVFGVAAPCPTDINADGQTNTQDLLLLLGSFGLVCD